MAGAFQRVGFQDNAFQIAAVDEIIGRRPRGRRTKIWDLPPRETVEEIQQEQQQLEESLVKVALRLEAANSQARIAALKPKYDALQARIRENEKRVDAARREEEEIAMVISLLEDL